MADKTAETASLLGKSRNSILSLYLTVKHFVFSQDCEHAIRTNTVLTACFPSSFPSPIHSLLGSKPHLPKTSVSSNEGWPEDRPIGVLSHFAPQRRRGCLTIFDLLSQAQPVMPPLRAEAESLSAMYSGIATPSLTRCSLADRTSSVRSKFALVRVAKGSIWSSH